MFREIIFAMTVLVCGKAQTTTVIDLTALVPRNRVREPATASSSGGAVGGNGVLPERKGGIDLNVLSVKPSDAPEPSVILEVEIRNIGNTDLEFPVNPNLADFEPSDVTRDYTYASAYISPWLEDVRQGTILLPGISLYGSEYTQGSLKKLGPGESVRVRAKVPLKPVNSNGTPRIPAHSLVKATLLIQRDFVSRKSGVLHEDSKQIVPQITSVNAIAFSFLP